MARYARQKAGGGWEFYSPGQLRIDRPDIDLPKRPTDADVAPYGLRRVEVSLPPVVPSDQVAENADEPTERADGTLVREWVVRDKTPAELESERSAVGASRVALAAAAREAGLLATDREAERWVASGVLPNSIAQGLMSAGLGAQDLRRVRLAALGAVTVSRTSPLVRAWQTAESVSDEQMDAVFAAAMEMEA